MANRVILNAIFPGEPVTWKRANFRGRRRFNPKFMRNAQKRIRRQLKMLKPTMTPDATSRFGFQATFHNSFRGDGDNFEKLILDALTGIVWLDDEQVDEGQWKKLNKLGGEVGIHLIVYVVT